MSLFIKVHCYNTCSSIRQEVEVAEGTEEEAIKELFDYAGYVEDCEDGDEQPEDYEDWLILAWANSNDYGKMTDLYELKDTDEGWQVEKVKTFYSKENEED